MLDIIKKRRSIRKYKSVPISWKKIIEIADAARHSPTAGNLQNFQLVYVDNPEKIEKITKASGQEWIKTAKGIFVVCVDYDAAKKYYENAEKLSDHSIGAVIENMLLEATAQGLGSCWVEEFDKNEVKKLLSIKTEPVALVTLGIPDEVPEEKNLKDFYEFLYYNKFGQPMFDIREKYQSPRLLEDVENSKTKFKRFLETLKRKLFK